jgi:hypothetical protein
MYSRKRKIRAIDGLQQLLESFASEETRKRARELIVENNLTELKRLVFNDALAPIESLPSPVLAKILLKLPHDAIAYVRSVSYKFRQVVDDFELLKRSENMGIVEYIDKDGSRNQISTNQRMVSIAFTDPYMYYVSDTGYLYTDRFETAYPKIRYAYNKVNIGIEHVQGTITKVVTAKSHPNMSEYNIQIAILTKDSHVYFKRFSTDKFERLDAKMSAPYFGKIKDIWIETTEDELHPFSKLNFITTDNELYECAYRYNTFIIRNVTKNYLYGKLFKIIRQDAAWPPRYLLNSKKEIYDLDTKSLLFNASAYDANTIFMKRGET